MCTKANIAAVVALLGILGTPGLVSAQGFGNYAAAQGLNTRQQPVVIQPSVKALADSYGFANKMPRARHVRAPK
jgi:hypothetical protein